MDQHLLPRHRTPTRFWYRSGAPGGDRLFNLALRGLFLLFGVGWTWGIAVAAETGARPGAAERLTANPFSNDAPAEAAFVMDALVRSLSDADELRGLSGDVRVILTEIGQRLEIPLPESLPENVHVELRPIVAGVLDRTGPGHPVDTAVFAPGRAGVWAVTLRADGEIEELTDVRVIVQVPANERSEGRIGAYNIGEWPFENGRRPPSDAYATPRGFVEVTPENMAMPVSEHFALRDFLTKGQADVWPKYVVMSQLLLDKLELTLQQLEKDGHPVERVGIISGFRTPWYNEHGGNTEGRGSLSRHMFGDAMDFYVDNDGDGAMDDLSGDGLVDVADARVLAAAADAVEKAHPELVGGIGIYRPTGAHRGFVHVDTRGFQARW